MNANLADLMRRVDRLPDGAGRLKDWIGQAVRISDTDPEMSLTRARKTLEYMVRDVYKRRIGEPPGTRPLDNLLQRIVKDGHVPMRISAYAHLVRDLGNVGTHGFDDSITSTDVAQSLGQLMPVVEWYFAKECPGGGVLVGGEGSDALLSPEGESDKAPPPDDVAGRSDRSSPAESPLDPNAESDGDLAPVEAVAAFEIMPIVPRGLSAFDALDSDFFLELLPGPRDARGLPDSIRFWKGRIETKSEFTFSVGLIYGPSGCGKSSFLKAGLLPRLDESILPIYVEASADLTEDRLDKALRRRISSLPQGSKLSETIAAVRAGRGLEPGRKLLLVIDQFEQWLHAHNHSFEAGELVTALRQVDGERVQCLLLVRDDFWSATSRVFQSLDLPMVESENMRMVDLFDLDHARRVLGLFGTAYGRLPADPKTYAPDQAAFVHRAVHELSEEGFVICVRLSLFALMLKNRPWTPATLDAMGGAAGVGVRFLAETFTGKTAAPEHKAYYPYARAVLAALLPEEGANIKGRMRPRAELATISGLEKRPANFSRLLEILDRELHLITPTDVESLVPAQSLGHAPERVPASYQLTHDYLVPPLRQWLTMERRRTSRGRAQLLLSERAAAWQIRRDPRHLPTWLEWLNIVLHTRRRERSPIHRQMMSVATRRNIGKSVLSAVVLLPLLCLGFTIGGLATTEGWNFFVGLANPPILPDTNNPIAIERALFKLRHPGNWPIDHELADHDPDSFFLIKSPNGSWIKFELFPANVFLATDDLTLVKRSIDSVTPIAMTNTDRSRFSKWGSYPATGENLKGRVELLPVWIRAAVVRQGDWGMLVTEFRIGIHDPVGVEFIEKSFEFEEAP